MKATIGIELDGMEWDAVADYEIGTGWVVLKSVTVDWGDILPKLSLRERDPIIDQLKWLEKQKRRAV